MTNCMEGAHELPDGSRYTFKRSTVTYFCDACAHSYDGAGYVEVVLKGHVVKPSGVYRELRFCIPVPCPACGNPGTDGNIPCGDENGPLFGYKQEVPIVMEEVVGGR